MQWTPTTFVILMLIFIALVLLIVFLFNNLRFYKKKVREEEAYKAKYPSSYLCHDGHKVRSLSECLIDNFLNQHGIKHQYEDVILKSADKGYKYDWYLPAIDTYVEFFGYSGKEYKENTANKVDFYRKHGLKMVAIEPTDLADIKAMIPAKFGKGWDQITALKHCPHCGNELDPRI